MISDDRLFDEAPKGRCFIPQEPMNYRDGKLVPMMNFNKARKFGEPIVLLPTGPQALNVGPTTWALKDGLRDFNDNDYLICVGNPSVMCMAMAIASSINRGKVNLLVHDKESGQYIKVEFDLYRKLGGGDNG